MNITLYPQSIASLQRRLLSQQQAARRIKDALIAFDLEIEHSIAFDADLKNDSQRKAKKAELQASEDYQALLIDLRRVEDLQTETEIELQLMQNQFSVLKLEVRERIAKLEASAA